MDALSRQCVQVKGHGGNEGFPFTGGHFRYFALVKDYGADQLNVEGNHVPFGNLIGNLPGFSDQPAARFFHRRKGLGQYFIENVLSFIIYHVFKTFFVRIGVFILYRFTCIGNALFKRFGFSFQLLIAEFGKPFIYFVDVVNERLYFFNFPVGPGSEKFCKKRTDHFFLSK